MTKPNMDVIEKAVQNLERFLCLELDIDLGHDVLRTLDDWSGLRRKIQDHIHFDSEGST